MHVTNKPLSADGANAQFKLQPAWANGVCALNQNTLEATMQGEVIVTTFSYGDLDLVIEALSAYQHIPSYRVLHERLLDTRVTADRWKRIGGAARKP